MKKEDVIEKSEKYLMKTYNRIPLVFVKGKGSWLWDTEGKKYLDFTTGISVTNLGHSHPAILSAIEEQVKNLLHVSNLFNIEPQAELAELLVKNSFADKVFFCNSGAEATEGSIKLARKWGKENGGRYKIISTAGSFHGRTLGALSATNQKYQKGFTPLLQGFKSVPFGEIKALEEALEDKEVCAIILEPIQGELGVVVPPDDYLRDVRELSSRQEILLILDEVQVGLGRTGKLFAYEHYSIEPDIIALAKALGGGIPCGAVLAKEEIAEYFTPGSHGTTLGGNPLAMRTGLAALRTVIETGLPANATEMGEYFISKLNNLQDKFTSLIKEVRGKGLMVGVEFRESENAKEVVNNCSEQGLLTILTEEYVIRILPPLNVNREEIDFALEKLEKSLNEVLNAETSS